MRNMLKIITSLSIIVIMLCSSILIFNTKTSYAKQQTQICELIIKKQTQAETEDEFTFRIKAWEEIQNSEDVEDVTISIMNEQNELIKAGDGQYVFTLKNNESKVFYIVEEAKYEVEELIEEGWTLVSIDDDPSLTKAEGTMAGSITHIFKNSNEQEPVIPDDNPNDNPNNNPNDNPEPNEEPEQNKDPIEKPQEQTNKEEKEIKKEVIKEEVKKEVGPKTGMISNITTIILSIGIITFSFGMMALSNQTLKIRSK